MNLAVKLTIAASLMAGPAGVLVFLLRGSGSDGRAAAEKHAVGAAPESEKVRELERRLAELEGRQLQLDALARAASHTETAPGNHTPEVDDPVQAAELEKQQQQREEAVEAEHRERLRAEPVDTEQARALSAKIEKLIDVPALAGTLISEVECGSKTCLVKASYANVEQQEAFMHTMMHELGHYDGFSRNEDINGRRVSRLYLTKGDPVRYLDQHGNEIDPPGGELTGSGGE